MTQTPHFNIASMPADGIGPEVISAAVEVVTALAATLKTFTIDFTHLPWGTAHYKEHGAYIPEGALDTLRTFDACLFGSVGAPGTAMHVSCEMLQWSNTAQTSLITSLSGVSSSPSAARSSCTPTSAPSAPFPGRTPPSRRSTAAASTGSSSGKTPRASTRARAAAPTAARSGRPPPRWPSSPAEASSASCASPLRRPAPGPPRSSPS